jgi:hypothetical protein
MYVSHPTMPKGKKRKNESVSDPDDAPDAAGAAGAAGPAVDAPDDASATVRVIRRANRSMTRSIATRIGITDQETITDVADMVTENVVRVGDCVAAVGNGVGNFLSSPPGHVLIAGSLAAGASYVGYRSLTSAQIASMLAMGTVTGLATSAGNAMMSNGVIIGITSLQALATTTLNRFTGPRN